MLDVHMLATELPIEKPEGIATGVLLCFPFDQPAVETLKQALETYRGILGLGTAGYWSPDHRSWIIAPTVWPAVRRELEQRGCQICE